MSKYSEYLKRYAKSHNISEHEAESHAIVQQVKNQFEKGDDKRAPQTSGWSEGRDNK